MRATATVVLALLATLRLPGAPAAQAPASAARLDALVTETMRAQKIPAITVAAASADGIVYSRAFGSADLENSVAATPATLIRTASIAKSISAVAAMTLVESGKLDLDAPLQSYCPPFPPKQWPITTRELLSHTSGIRHYNPGEMESTRHYRWMADGFAIFAADPLLFRPGSGYQYSTYGYTVVGCVIEGAAGERFQDYVAAHVLRPAGMTHTFVDDALDIVPHRARGYQKIDGQVKNAALMDSSYKIPGGGYVTTAEDLVQFAQALLAGKLLKPATLAQMWTPTPVSGKDSYGLGFEVLEGGKLMMHTGGQPGTSTVLLIAPQQRLALAVLANMDEVQLKELVHALAAQLQFPLPPP
ncbi:MAG: serine hydrolase domain-containing protein [Steroidobacteraceae bacterium]